MKTTLVAHFGGWFKAQDLSGLRRAICFGTVAALAFLLPANPVLGAMLPGHVPAAVALMTPVGSLPATNHLNLAIGLHLRNKAELTNLLHDLYNPASTNYHRYLTPAEFTEKFGPTQEDYVRLAAFAEAHGLRVTERHANRMLLDVEGPVANIEEALQVKMHTYHHPRENRDFFAANVDPTVPDELPVTDISGLNNYERPHPKYHLESANGLAKAAGKLGSGPGGTYLGSDFRVAYAPGVTLTGTGQSVGLLQFDGYALSDIQQYETLAGLPNVTLTNVLLDGFNGLPTGNGGEVETSLDIEMVISMAPGVTQVVLYEAGPFGFQNDILSRMANDNSCRQLSCSWGWLGGPATTTDQLFLQMAAQGQTFYNASGDDDAFLPGQVDDPTTFNAPSDSPNIVQVGGTTLSTTGPHGAYVSETVWQTGLDFGSSGGISSFYPIPIWQQGIDMTANGGSTTMRDTPDVAMTADNVLVISDNGVQQPVGGTSCAAPLWGGFTALINQQAVLSGKPSVGFLNPAIYAIAQSSNYNLCFNDITTGNNTNSGSPTLFFATPGYDLCTGLGSPTGSNLINTLVPQVITPFLTIVTNIVSGGNQNGIIDNNECNSLFVSVANFGSTNATSVIGQLSTSTPGVAIGQATVSYGNIPAGATVTNLSPFQISTSPSFICGTPIIFTLTLQSDQSTDTRIFTVITGENGQPVRFDSTNFVPVVAGPGGSSSPIVVSNVTTALKHVTVSVFVQDQLDLGLTLQLIAPDGTSVTLTQGNGDTGQNYGSDCTDQDRTTFDDNGNTSITAGFAPFIGTFQPNAPLAAFIGKSGTNVNGGWQLQATDTFGFENGIIDCWSLILTPAECTDGGGQCPGVDMALGMTGLPNPVTVGSNLTYTISVTNNGPDTATAVAVSQTLPANVNFVSAVSSQGFCTESAGTVTANLGTMVINGTATITVVVKPTLACTNFSTATVGAQEQELNPFNNSATVKTVVRSVSADLSVVLTAAPSPVLLDSILTYTATVVNNGPAVATNVLVTNTLPLNVGLNSTTVSQGTFSQAANLVVASLGNMNPGSNATVVMKVQPLVLGAITATSAVSSSVPDPSTINNFSTVTVSVTPAADLGLTLSGPSSVVLSSNITYQLTVVNNGPSAATSVNIKDTMPANVTFVSATNATVGAATPTFAGGIVSCLVSNLAVNATTTLTIVGGTTGLSNLAPVTVTDLASVSGGQADPATNNNSASLSTLVTFPMINVTNAGFLLEGESFLPTNGMIEPGETVTMLLELQNLGNINTSNGFTATLLATNGVTPVGSQVQNYGLLAVGGAPVGRLFNFTANGVSGGTITATLSVQNGTSNLPTPIKFTFSLASLKGFANTNNIVIPDHGEASPYPSSNIVSGVTGLTGKVTVTLTNMNHTFPDDIDMLLVGPLGQSVLLMSHAGGGGALSNTSLTFDDGSTQLLSSNSQILSGTYAPSAYGSVSFPLTNTPAPPYSTNLTVFNGLNPNGAWRLFVFDSSPGDQGIIVGGWSLNITSGSQVNPVADLGVTGVGAPSTIVDGANLTYTFTITNNGPSVATSVQFTNVLPAGATFVSATNNAHVACTVNNGVVSFTLNNLSGGSNVVTTIVVIPTTAGTQTSVATITGTGSDPNQSNNSATVLTTATEPTADMTLALSGPASATVTSNFVYTIVLTNTGPGVALNVAVTNPLNGLTLGAASSSSVPGAIPFSTNGSAVCLLGNLNPNFTATVSFVMSATVPGTITNTATVSTASVDVNSTNNSASVVTVINAQAPLIVPAGARLIGALPNGSLVPGQTASVSLQLANIGTADTSSLVATLLATNGVISPSAPQNYGVLAHGGPAQGKSFAFIPTGANNGVVGLTLQLNDGANNLGTVVFNLNLPGTNAFANNAAITIPDHGPAAPYPATIVISNITGVVSKATVTLSNLNHQFPNDLEIMVVAPSGQSTVLMSGVGGGQSISNVNLTFDDAAGASLPATGQFSGQIVSGTFRPTDAALSEAFPQPAPSEPYGTALSALEGSSANGTWSLYVLDNSPGDNGIISQGWSLNLVTVSPVDGASDIGVSLASPVNAVFQGGAFTYSVAVSNSGPADASNVILTNTLPAGVSLLSATAVSTLGPNNTLIFNLGPLSAGTITNFTTTFTSSVAGQLVDQVSVGADQTDLNLANNTAQASFTVAAAPRLFGKVSTTNGPFALTLSLTGPQGIYAIVATTNINTSLTNWTLVGVATNTTGSFQFTDTNTTGFNRKFYRAVFTP